MAFATNPCPICGNSKSVKAERCRTCYFKENGQALAIYLKPFQGKREGSGAWKGGRHPTGDGYMYVYVEPTSPYNKMSRKDGRVREHRLIMAQSLGRCLEPWEIVHHKNGDKTNNSIENLELLPDPTKHRCFSTLLSYIQSLEDTIIALTAKLAKYEEVL